MTKVLGFTRGTLACSATCTFDTSGCSTGNGGNGGVTCTDTCASEGYECGIHTICGKATDCGTCPAGEYCIAGICVECVDDNDCPRGYECTFGTCTPEECIPACGPGERCERGICVTVIECIDDDDCEEGETCEDGKCVKDLTDEEIEDILDTTIIRFPDGIGTRLLLTSNFTINFTNIGNETLRNLEFIIEQPDVELQAEILHPRKIWGWDLLEMVGWILKNYVKDLKLMEWEVAEPKYYRILRPGESIDLDLSTFDKGIYLIELNYKTQKALQKVILE